MEVILADYLGFCYGVKRAITIAQENASSDGKACTLGPIIHNPQMVERLRSEGVGTVDELAEMDEGTIIIRSHGVGPRIYAEAERRGLELVDATCPHVKKAQLSAKGPIILFSCSVLCDKTIPYFQYISVLRKKRGDSNEENPKND
ncbi:MAG: hypothetical protein IIZ87_08310, partial [Selenomonas sp.]|nr:hypothetical protein [Selenomonas sp.]